MLMLTHILSSIRLASNTTTLLPVILPVLTSQCFSSTSSLQITAYQRNRTKRKFFFAILDYNSQIGVIFVL